MSTILIGIDDTDTKDTPGTGKLARQLVAEIERSGGRYHGTTGHQFLIDPAIPYTGHNRGICVGVEWEGPASDLEFAFALIRSWSAEGSDPGVCLANADAVASPVIEWGNRALTEVLTMKDAAALAGEYHLDLRPLGGTGQGIIGALASVGLRVGGESGRFVDMPGLRTLPAVVTAKQLDTLGIQIEYTTVASIAHRDAAIRTLDWIRPRLSRGKPVLSIEWSEHEHAWVPLDRKNVHPVEQVGH